MGLFIVGCGDATHRFLGTEGLDLVVGIVVERRGRASEVWMVSVMGSRRLVRSRILVVDLVPLVVHSVLTATILPLSSVEKVLLGGEHLGSLSRRLAVSYKERGQTLYGIQSSSRRESHREDARSGKGPCVGMAQLVAHTYPAYRRVACSQA